MEIGTTRCCIGKQVPWFSRNSRMLDVESIHKLPYHVFGCTIKPSNLRFAHSYWGSARKNWMSNVLWRTYTMPVSLEESSSEQPEDYSDDEGSSSEDLPEEPLDQSLSSDELKALLLDSQRKNLTKKLSEANQQNRFLKRQALVTLSEEIAQYEIPEGSRKINGKYVQSHLLSRLRVLQEKLKEQIKDVDAAKSKEVSLFWCGMAESVQVMGSFDGWSQGEHLSPEYDGSFTKFSATLMLRPGRYEIKFLVDGDWQLSPEYPTIGEGLTENNLLIVE
ncbi:protein PTST, chloroplastic isoform X2 [Populus trichocarpa]|uniref:AMP-activated protein kinase glycogen-binding domain-containing protein n=1 Tax=Populus trichocarpa TaxID=3694 RepID=A0A3N7G504_POPTR|nr:protein PTST, chloroplastic isoform X2 [Populus trichocarpa]|eukprot:XP_024445187.1 protein PTST, chloroplastic isoform X2 [Populus trichocarpa]